MKYNQIIEILKEHNLLLEEESCDIDFSYISYNSKDIKNNTLFICKGFTFKKEYLEEAIKNGITCYVSETDFKVDIPKIIVNDVRKALSIISMSFYKDNLFKIGITGTKGKTTTNYFIHNILKNYLGYKPGFIATHYFYTGKNEGENPNTTPESLDLHKYLHDMSDSNLKYVTMEVSSQATKLDRVYGMNYDIGCFLNIGEDHISPLEHTDFFDYLNCKVEFLKMCDKVIIFDNTDYYDEIIEKIKDKQVITYGYNANSDYVISNINSDNGITFKIKHNNEQKEYKINMKGIFNVTNASCAIVIANLLQIDDESIKKGLLETQVAGRMNFIENDICPIIVDYAHNYLSGEALYKSLKHEYPNKKIKALFGCPGAKGLNRRKDMGTLAGIYADYIYLTAEDPAYSSVTDICNEINEYIKPYNKPVEIIEDREEAIAHVINNRTKDDVIVLLGKSDEDYQIINGKTIPYKTDIKIAQELVSKIKEKKHV